MWAIDGNAPAATKRRAEALRKYVSSSVRHHELAAHLAAGHAGEGLWQLLHRQAAVDHGLDLALCVPLRQLGERLRVALRLAARELAPEHADDRSPLQQREVERECRNAALREADHEVATAPGD